MARKLKITENEKYTGRIFLAKMSITVNLQRSTGYGKTDCAKMMVQSIAACFIIGDFLISQMRM